MWYNKWFGTKYYDMLYDHRDHAEAQMFINNMTRWLMLPPAARILDLGCGKGRHSLLLNQLGYRVTGIDLSASNIEHCQLLANESLEFYVHDMRRYFRINSYACVMNLFTSFGYFEKLHHNDLVVQAAVANLHGGGVLVLDYFNAHVLPDCFDSPPSIVKNDIEFVISKKREDNFIVKTIEVNDGGEHFTFYERVEVLYPAQFEQLLAKNNLKIIKTFGNYALENYEDNTSPRYIVVAQKK